MTLRRRLLLFLGPLAVLTVAAMTVLARYAVLSIMTEQVAQRGLALAEAVSHQPGAALAVRRRSERELLPLLQAAIRAGASYAAAVDREGVVVAHTNVVEKGRRMEVPAKPARLPGKPLLLAAAPVVAPTTGEELFFGEAPEGPAAGSVVVAMPLTDALETSDSIARRVMAVISFVGAIALALALFLTSTVVSRDVVLAILGASPEALIVMDDEGRVRVANAAARRILGDPAGRRIHELFASGAEALAPENLARLDGETRQFEAEALGSEHAVPVLCSVARLQEREGGYVLSLRDITQRKAAEEKLARYADELKRSNAELEQFAYVASHDLQEPLRKVASFCQLLQRRYKGKLDQTADEYIGFAVDGAERMRGLIQGLLQFSRVGRQDMPLEGLALEQPLKIALDNLTLTLKEAKAVVDAGPLPRVKGNESQLAQVFQNLIANAVKFRAAGRAPRITISAERDGRRWTVSLKDNGIGFETKYADRIFQVFQRLHTREEYPGSGIGLAICRRIVERHGGRIWAESAVGEGTTFKFTLRPEA